jgi:hypothetical protein
MASLYTFSAKQTRQLQQKQTKQLEQQRQLMLGHLAGLMQQQQAQQRGAEAQQLSPAIQQQQITGSRCSGWYVHWVGGCVVHGQQRCV